MISLNWHTHAELATQLSHTEADWLFDKGSLTRRLIQLSQNRFSIEILSEKTQELRQDEYKYLNTPPSRQEWVREVYLKGKELPWIYARSVILCNNIDRKSTNILANIGTNPLGSVLFGMDQFHRSAIEATKYPIKFLPFKYSGNDLWARRSKFHNGTHTVLVQEIFLFDIWKTIKSMK